jgi:hypothetical protein
MSVVVAKRGRRIDVRGARGPDRSGDGGHRRENQCCASERSKSNDAIKGPAMRSVARPAMMPRTTIASAWG